MPNEIELKLRIAAADVQRLRRHPAIRQPLAGKPVTRHLISIYYDTPDLKLLDAAISLRVRRMSGGWFQAVKGAGHSLAGLHQRMEWEDVIAKGEPDFTKIVDPSLAKIFAEQSLRDALRPIFTTDVQRTEWQLQYQDGSTIEVALDLGELQNGKKKEVIQEVELELKHGNAVHLFELALALQADIPLHIENVSKAQRGYAWYREQPLGTSKAQAIELHPKTPANQALQQISWECLRQLQSNQDMVLHGEDPEGVHQMHIALRRLRAALKLFKCEVADLHDELKWLGTVLGEARDWDVLLHETLPAAFKQLAFGDPPGDLQQNALQALASAASKRAYVKLRAALNSQRYQRLLLTLGAWLGSDDYHNTRKVVKVAEHLLERNFEKLKSHSKNLSELSPAQRHKVRIEAKHLRYAAEFFLSLYSSKKQSVATQPFIDKLKSLQTSLGMQNDIAVAERLLQLLADKQPQANISGISSQIVHWNRLRAEKNSRRMDQAWRTLVHAKPYWD